jgi:hypothetical protein
MPDGGQLYLDPQRAINAGQDLAAAGKNLAGERNTAGHHLMELSAKKPWGTDDIGAAFDKEYAPMEQKVMEAWLQISEYIQSIGSGAVQSVHENLQTDQAAGTRVINTYKGA